MAFCTECGKQLPAGAKFCLECGTKVGEATCAGGPGEREEYVGTYTKCPACGVGISELTAICPACGTELNSEKISHSFQKFTDGLNKCDKAISKEPPASRWPWTGWETSARILFVVACLIFYGLPLLVYVGYALLRPKKPTAAEKSKRSFIENYAFANDRETLLEALLFVEAQTAALAQGKADAGTVRWMDVWKQKADALHEKVQLVIPHDATAKQSYADICANAEKVRKARNRTTATIACVGVLVAVLLAAGSVFAALSEDGDSSYDYDVLEKPANYDEVYNLAYSPLAKHLPELPSKYGHVDSDSGNYLYVDVYQVAKPQFDAYVSACQAAGFTVDYSKYETSYFALDEQGYDLYLYYEERTQTMTVSLDSFDVVK